ncbi:hypothetical protein SADUNF_Sadunf02G0175400 [Salix dunnii]|uniref:Uncharacterized protein n=1 Tax=Salix dunnii TaxID=1413687 RepID=A0A835N8V8_9ROSI|nr:hypothetical protein SADUNF_Sadunf02G0175400 [Salix dunnii]
MEYNVLSLLMISYLRSTIMYKKKDKKNKGVISKATKPIGGINKNRVIEYWIPNMVFTFEITYKNLRKV